MSDLSVFITSKIFVKLLLRGKDQGYLSPEEINDAIPAGIIDPSGLDQIMENQAGHGLAYASVGLFGSAYATHHKTK